MPPSAITAFIDKGRIDRLLARWVEDPADRAFVLRCLLEEGPAHHRGANFVLLALLEPLLVEAERTAGAGGVSAGDGATVPVPLRLPPHLAGQIDDGHFPLRMPTAPLERLAAPGSQAFAAMVDCLTDGPPQHALANAIMVRILDRLLAAVARDGRDARVGA